MFKDSFNKKHTTFLTWAIGLGTMFFATSHSLASEGCNYVNTGVFNGQKSGTSIEAYKTFNVGDVITATLTLTGGAHIEAAGTVINNASGTTKSFTFSSNGNFRIYLDATFAASAVFSVSCTPFSTQTSQPPKSVQATISRSQSQVVTTNVGSRLNNIGSPVGVFRGPSGAGRTTPGVDRNSPNRGGLNRPAPSLNLLGSLDSSWASAWHHKNTGTSALKNFAQYANFDTSTLGMGVVNQTIQPAKVVDTRTENPTARPITVWGYSSFTKADNSLNNSETDSRYHGDVWGYNLGADYRFRDNFYAGASLGFSRTQLSTGYNAGHYNEDAWTFTPYAVYLPAPNVKLALMGGFAAGNIEMDRHNKLATGETTSKMWYGSFNGSYDFEPLLGETPLSIKANLGLLVTNKIVGAYSESDDTAIDRTSANTRQLKPGMEVAYMVEAQGNRLEPYISTAYVYDFMNPTNDDANAIHVGGGLRAEAPDLGLSGTLEAQSEMGRDHYQEYSISALLAYSIPLGSEAVQDGDQLHLELQSDQNLLSHTFGTGLNYQPGRLPMRFGLKVSQTRIFSSQQDNYAAIARIEGSF